MCIYSTYKIATLLIDMLVGNGLPIHGNDVSIQQPRRDNLYPQLGGEPLENLPNGGSFD